MKNILSSPSAKFLLVSNLLVILMVFIAPGPIGGLMLSYVIQSIVIGWYNARRMLDLKNFSTEGVEQNGNPVLPTDAARLGLVGFFIFHYGFFHLFYLVAIFSAPEFGISGNTSLFWMGIVGGLVFLYNHHYSYKHHKREYKDSHPNIGKMMFYPYARIIPMHIIIIFGGIFLDSGGSTVVATIFFILLKTVADLVMHNVEHNFLYKDTELIYTKTT